MRVHGHEPKYVRKEEDEVAGQRADGAFYDPFTQTMIDGGDSIIKHYEDGNLQARIFIERIDAPFIYRNPPPQDELTQPVLDSSDSS
jgi:hypothetical protein